MAQRVTTTFIDDLDGSAAEGTISFGFAGKSYDIDLSAANAAKLRDLFAPYVGAARRAGRSGVAVRRASARASDRDESQAIRAWAEAQGLTVASRGRISSTVLAAYHNRGVQAAVAASPADEAPAAAPKKKARRRSKAKAAAE